MVPVMSILQVNAQSAPPWARAVDNPRAGIPRAGASPISANLTVWRALKRPPARRWAPRVQEPRASGAKRFPDAHAAGDARAGSGASGAHRPTGGLATTDRAPAVGASPGTDRTAANCSRLPPLPQPQRSPVSLLVPARAPGVLGAAAARARGRSTPLLPR